MNIGNSYIPSDLVPKNEKSDKGGIEMKHNTGNSTTIRKINSNNNFLNKLKHSQTLKVNLNISNNYYNSNYNNNKNILTEEGSNYKTTDCSEKLNLAPATTKKIESNVNIINNDNEASNRFTVFLSNNT
jgi:hypothetical protein